MAVAAPIRFPSPATMSSSSMPGPSNFNHNFDHHPQPVSGSGPTPMFQPYYLRPAYRFKANNANDMSMMMMEGGPGRRLRKNVANVRRHIDYVAVVMNHMDARLWQNGVRDRVALQPDALYQNAMLPPASLKNCPVDCVLSKFVRAAMNKVKCPIYSLCWTPEGKRLITGASTGEFTLWNGTAFNFETILQAHDSAIRALRWSHNDQWLVSADHDGYLKYWQPNMNNVHMYQAHKNEPIRALSFAPTDIKLVTASDDGTARIWDFARCAEERVLRGHGSDVRSVDWHPQKGLIVTGSRDTQQPVKLWDPKSGTCLATLHDHKNSVMAVQWNRNGNWLLTASRDHLIKLYDIRIMREMHTYRGHKKEVTALAWHPVHEGLFVSGGGDGSLAYWLVHNEKEVGLLEHAHDQAVWTLEWHPLGHILASGSNDNNTKFWTRNRPGDTQEDIFGLASFTTTGIGAVLSGSTSSTDKDADKNKSDSGGPTAPVIPGMGLDADVRHGMNRDVGSGHHALPGLGGGPLLFPEDPNARGHPQSHIGAKRTLIKQPPPKRAQRQFERMWNVAKPGAGGDEFEYDDASGPMEEEEFRRPKTSLLGRRPRPDELPPLMDQQQPPEQMRPSYSPPPPGPGPMNPGGPNHWGPPPSLNMMPQAPFPQMPPPLPQLGPMWQLPPTGGGPPGSLPPPPLMGPPPGMMRMGPPQMPPMMNVGGPMPMNMMPPSMQMQDIDYRMGPPMMQQPGVSGHFNPGIMEMPPTSVGGGGDIDLRGGGGSWRTAPPLTAESSSDNAQAPPTSSTSRDPRRRETNQSQPVAAVGANDASTTSAQSVRDPRRRAVGSSRGS